jgi:hypothetical protein
MVPLGKWALDYSLKILVGLKPACLHYMKIGHFRRPEADENRPNADENSRFRRLPDENRPTK